MCDRISSGVHGPRLPWISKCAPASRCARSRARPGWHAVDRLSICLVSQEYPEETGWGGIGTYTHELAHSIARAGHRVCVVSRTRLRERVDREDDGVLVY